MTQEQTIASLLIALVVSLGVGVMIGYLAHADEHYPQQACTGAEQTKAAMEEVRSCYALLATHLGAKAQEVGH